MLIYLEQTRYYGIRVHMVMEDWKERIFTEKYKNRKIAELKNASDQPNI